MELSEAIALFGVLGGLAAFVAGLIQYRRAQQWKRLEFVASEIKLAFADSKVQLALHFLDWNLSTYDLRHRDDELELREVWLGDSDLESAMVPHPARSSGFSLEEARIREAFDSLLEVFRRFEHFVEVGLVKPDDLRPYLRYWLERLCTPTRHGKPRSVLQAIWRYIEFYEYDEVMRFVCRFNYNPRGLLEQEPPPAVFRRA